MPKPGAKNINYFNAFDEMDSFRTLFCGIDVPK